MLTLMIDAQEGHDVTIADMQLHGLLVTLLVDLAPDVYGPYLTTDKNRQLVLHV